MDTGVPEIRFAIDAVRQAAVVTREVYTELTRSALTKKDRSPVTVADFAAQAIIAYLLGKTFPHDPLVAEENSAVLKTYPGETTLTQVTKFVSRRIGSVDRESVCEWIDRGMAQPTGRFWTLDPVDGTKGFLRGGQWAVALALIVEGQVEVGVLGCPHLKECSPAVEGPGFLLVAARGEGSWVAPLQGEDWCRLHVSSCQDPTRARILRSVEPSHTNSDQTTRLARFLGVRVPPLRMDSQAKYAVIASGGAELIFRLPAPTQPDYREKIWDHAAGFLVGEEAGGRVTDLNGRDLDFSCGHSLAFNRGILASNGFLHEAALQAVKLIQD